MTKNLGRIIKTARKDRRTTQATLAIHTKIPRERISKIESGKLQPTAAEISAVAIYLENLDIIRAWWQNSDLHGATTYICGRMGVPVATDMEVTARQFSRDIVNRALRISSMIQDMPSDERGRQEHIILAGQEAYMIINMATALRLLLCDIKGG
jgi:transcriptional regulator with XRE-family HTH domain